MQASAVERGRRGVLAWAAAGALALWACPALAGSYLDRAALLVSQANRDTEFLRRRLSDRELARVIHELCEARSRSAAAMMVPKEVAQAHPHLLLVLEHHERAADAAAAGKTERFLVERGKAIEEEQILRSVLRQLGWSLPDA
jgi:hypothetical protein